MLFYPDFFVAKTVNECENERYVFTISLSDNSSDNFSCKETVKKGGAEIDSYYCQSYKGCYDCIGQDGTDRDDRDQDEELDAGPICYAQSVEQR